MSVPGGPRRCAWFHCFAGVAGDMALGSLVDAGADLEQVIRILERVPLRGWGLERSDERRGGLSCTRVEVKVTGYDPSSRRHGEIADLIRSAELPPRVEERSLAVFDALARAEAAIHGLAPAEVHLHEAGGHDAVVDVVGTCAALEVLGVDEVRASAVAVGHGTVRARHGLLPNPPPAVVALLRGAPVRGVDVDVELTTPTGAALLRGLGAVHGPLPAMVVERSGRGAGSAELPRLPNCTEVVVGTLTDEGAPGDPGQGAEWVESLTVMECNVDDVTGEQLAVAVDQLLDAGALDAWLTPATMKKGRPAFTVHMLAREADLPALRPLLLRSTGSFGARSFDVRRWAVPRRTETVTVDGHPIRLKVGPHRTKPELEDVRAAAAASRLPVQEVQARALEAWRRRWRP